MKKLNLTYSQLHAIIKAVIVAVGCIAGAIGFFGLWWLLWVFQPLLGVPM